MMKAKEAAGHNGNNILLVVDVVDRNVRVNKVGKGLVANSRHSVANHFDRSIRDLEAEINRVNQG